MHPACLVGSRAVALMGNGCPMVRLKAPNGYRNFVGCAFLPEVTPHFRFWHLADVIRSTNDVRF
jgi:hypothetical protein